MSRVRGGKGVKTTRLENINDKIYKFLKEGTAEDTLARVSIGRGTYYSKAEISNSHSQLSEKGSSSNTCIHFHFSERL